MPTGETTKASTISKLHHNVREPARSVDMVPALKHNSLLSGPKFADANYITVLTPEEVLIFDGEDLKLSASKEAVLRGWRDIPSGLWRVPLETTCAPRKSEYILLPRSSEDAINNVYELPSTKQIVRYLHGCAGFPAKTTWIKAIRAGNYATWPHLTLQGVQKHFPESDETQQGHMRSIKQSIRSTKIKKEPTKIAINDDEWITVPLKKHHDVYVSIDEAKETIYSDQTGAFPVKSRSGSRYIMIMCEMDSNAIISEPMNNRTSGEMVRAYQVLLKRLRLAGLTPKKHVLDNEMSKESKEAVKMNDMEYELVPKGQHRRNIAEKAIQTWKAHAISVFSGMDSKCPLFLWDLMLPQIDMQVNMLRQSNTTPKICAHAHLHGQHDFNRHPLAPLGIEVHSYVPPDKRKTWEVKSKKGYYFGTSMEHYRYYMAYIPETGGIQGSETMFFKHKYITMPALTSADAIVQAAKELIDALKNKMPPPLTQPSTAQIKTISDIFTPNMNEPNAIVGSETTAPDPATSQRVRTTEGAQAQRVPIVGGTPPVIEEPAQVVRVQEQRVPIVEGTPTFFEEPAQLIVESTAGPSSPQAQAPPMITQDDPEDIVEAAKQFAKAKPELPRWLENYVEQRKIDSPATNTRSRRSITDEIMLSVLEMTSHKIDPCKAAGRKYPMAFLAEMAGAVLDGATGELLEYRHLLKNPAYREIWGGAFGKEVGRLAQGLDGIVEGTDTIDFIDKSDVPPDRWKDVTYARIVCNYRPEKEDPNRVRITVGGDRINFTGDCGTPTADILTIKLLFNSVISTPGAQFMTMDISNFYLETPLNRKEYLKMKLSDMPDNIIQQYNLEEKATTDGWVYIAVKKGMYGLPQAGILAQELLEKRLNAHGYKQSRLTPGLWTHEWRPITFTLVVDDFGVKYVGKEHAEHLVNTIKEHYKVTTDWEG